MHRKHMLLRSRMASQKSGFLLGSDQKMSETCVKRIGKNLKRSGQRYNIGNTYSFEHSRSPSYAAILNVKKWKEQNSLHSKMHVGTFPATRLGRTAEKGMTWPWHDLLKTYFTELIQLKYKLIISIKTMGCCGLACVVWLKSCEFSKRKSVLIVGNSSMMCLL